MRVVEAGGMAIDKENATISSKHFVAIAQIRKRIYTSKLRRRRSLSDVHRQTLVLRDRFRNSVNDATAARQPFRDFIIGRAKEMEPAMEIEVRADRVRNTSSRSCTFSHRQ
jgi:hypothetical protein